MNTLQSFSSGSRAVATSKMEHFVIIVNGFQPLTFITKRSILDIAAVLDPSLIRLASGKRLLFSNTAPGSICLSYLLEKEEELSKPFTSHNSTETRELLIKVIYFSTWENFY